MDTQTAIAIDIQINIQEWGKYPTSYCVENVARPLFFDQRSSCMTNDVVAFLDTETTGLRGSREIVEIGILLIEYAPVFGPGWGGGEEFKQYRRMKSGGWSSLVRAKQPIDSGAEAVHGISDADQVDAPPIGELENTIKAMLAWGFGGGVDYIAGHGLPFDFWMLNRDLPFIHWDDIPRLDTLSLQKQHGIDYGGGLPACLSRGNVTLPSGETAHRALTDAKLSAQILEKLAEQTGLRFAGLTKF